MFAYNPIVEDRSGEIYATAMNNAAAANMAGLQDLGKGIASGIKATKQAVAMAVGGPAAASAVAAKDGGGDSGMLSSILESYSNRKMVEAKASSYDDIGKILQGGMFSNNPQASEAFSNIAKQKDPYQKVLAYEQIFDLLGPVSNAQMAQNRFGYSSSLANQQTAARNQVPANQAVPNQSAAMDVQGWAGRLKENR